MEAEAGHLLGPGAQHPDSQSESAPLTKAFGPRIETFLILLDLSPDSFLDSLPFVLHGQYRFPAIKMQNGDHSSYALPQSHQDVCLPHRLLEKILNADRV